MQGKDLKQASHLVHVEYQVQLTDVLEAFIQRFHKHLQRQTQKRNKAKVSIPDHDPSINAQYPPEFVLLLFKTVRLSETKKLVVHDNGKNDNGSAKD